MSYKIGDQFIFTIDRIYSSKKHEESRYGIKGFENFVLSKRKLDELLKHNNIQKADEIIMKAHDQGIQVGKILKITELIKALWGET